jgi:hypothetical protein
VIDFENPKAKAPALYPFISEHACPVNDSLKLTQQQYSIAYLYFRLNINDFFTLVSLS